MEEVKKEINPVSLIIIFIISLSITYVYHDSKDWSRSIPIFGILLIFLLIIDHIGIRKLLSDIGFKDFIYKQVDKSESNKQNEEGNKLKDESMNNELSIRYNNLILEKNIINSELLKLKNEREYDIERIKYKDKIISDQNNEKELLRNKIQELERLNNELNIKIRSLQHSLPINKTEIKIDKNINLNKNIFFSESENNTNLGNQYLFAPQNNIFYRISSSFIPFDTIYIINSINTSEGTFEFVSDQTTLNQAFSYVDNLKDTCDLYGVNRPSATNFRYRNGKKGKVRKEGEYWVIVEKIQLEWD